MVLKPIIDKFYNLQYNTVKKNVQNKEFGVESMPLIRTKNIPNRLNRYSHI